VRAAPVGRHAGLPGCQGRWGWAGSVKDEESAFAGFWTVLCWRVGPLGDPWVSLAS
jgi:hypothetical protein